MNRDFETVYEFLADKIGGRLESKLDVETFTDLDGILWACAKALSDENSGNQSSESSGGS